MVRKSAGEMSPAWADPFWTETFRGHSYLDVIRAIVRGLGSLRDEFPQMAGFDPEAAERDLVAAPRKLVAYACDMDLAPLDPNAPPGTHARRLLVHRPTSRRGVIVTIEFRTPAEGRQRRSTSERRLPPHFLGGMFLEVEVDAADDRLKERIWAMLREEGLELRNDLA